MKLDRCRLNRLASTKLTPEEQLAVLYWPEIADIPIIDKVNSKTKQVWNCGWINIDFSKVDFRAKLANGDYDDGIAIVTGKTLTGRYAKYLAVFDFDGMDAIGSSIITAFRENGKLQIEKSVYFEGCYYCDGDIQRSGVENKHPTRTREECKVTIDFLEKWFGFYIYNGIDRRDVVTTGIKWTIIAPFNFVLKQLTRKYMNGISFSGELHVKHVVTVDSTV